MYAEAAEEFGLATSLDPTQDVAIRGLAGAYVAMGETARAEEAYKEAISLRPHYWGGYNLYYARTYGPVGTGTWSQFGHIGNMFGQTNVRFMYAFMTDSSVTYRGHELYEIILWYDP